MRLLGLEFPIAAFKSDQVLGGSGALLGSRKKFRNLNASYFLKGAEDETIFVDSSGSIFRVEKILLYELKFVDKIWGAVALAGSNDGAANVDMELVKTGQYSLDEFCKEVINRILQHPEWWSKEAEDNESSIRAMFDGCQTFAQAIERIGIWDDGKSRQPRGKSYKTVDLRKKS